MGTRRAPNPKPKSKKNNKQRSFISKKSEDEASWAFTDSKGNVSLGKEFANAVVLVKKETQFGGARLALVTRLTWWASKAPKAARTPLSEKARSARAPMSPDRLMGALQDRAHVDQGRLLAAKPLPNLSKEALATVKLGLKQAREGKLKKRQIDLSSYGIDPDGWFRSRKTIMLGVNARKGPLKNSVIYYE